MTSVLGLAGLVLFAIVLFKCLEFLGKLLLPFVALFVACFIAVVLFPQVIEFIGFILS
tara:strand:- start:314 stop:487 length:174 start_codon:yes stop_codon:yes gene_type:complete